MRSDAMAYATITLAMRTEAIGAERRNDGSEVSAFRFHDRAGVTD